MNKFLISLFIFTATYALSAQDNRASVLQDLEKNQQAVIPADQVSGMTATLKSASRLFGEKDDLTTVITVLPAGSVVEILDSDSTYYKVGYEESEGYIFKRHAVINEAAPAPPEVSSKVTQQPSTSEREQVLVQSTEEQRVSRFTYLERKYGSDMAAKLVAGKVWKGMSAEMIQDSWGSPRKINRVISGNLVKEEWIFKNTWLYLENDALKDWGPIK